MSAAVTGKFPVLSIVQVEQNDFLKVLGGTQK